MPKNSNTHPVVIVDKNGKQTTVHRRNDNASSARFSMKLQPVPPINQERSQQEKAILEAARAVNDEAGFARVPEISLRRALKEADDTAIKLIADAVELDGFKEMLVHAEVEPEDVASIASVYDPDIDFVDKGTNARIAEYQRTINKAHIYMRGPITGPWELYAEPEAVQAKAKRYVAVFVAVNRGGMKAPSNDLMDLALNANEEDYGIILRVLRENQNATLEQIEFILNGGPSSISAGAL